MVNVKVCFVELVIGGCHSFLSLRSSERFEPRTEGGTLDRCKLGSRAEGVPVVLSEMFPEGLSMHGYHYLDAFVSESLIGAAGAESLSHALRELPSFQIEWNLELVRRALYPELPSRCQSIFCLESVEEFRDWPELMTGEGQLVEILVPDNGKCVTLDSRMLGGGFLNAR